jgi:hypothetical protein
MRYFIPYFLILISCTDVEPSAVSQQSVSFIENERQTIANHISIAMIEKKILYDHYSQTLASLTGLKQGLTRGEAIDVVRLHFAPKAGDGIVSTAQAEFKQNDHNILLFSAADKSKTPVSAEEIFISFKNVDDLEFVNDFGLRIKCVKNEVISNWQSVDC